jgi:hypothetical protein
MMKISDGRLVELVSLNPGKDYATIKFEGKEYQLAKKHLNQSIPSKSSNVKRSSWYTKVCEWAASGLEFEGQIHKFDKVLTESGKSHAMDYCNKPECPSHAAIAHVKEKGLSRLPVGTALVFQSQNDSVVKLYACHKCKKYEVVRDDQASDSCRISAYQTKHQQQMQFNY